ncbi:hypothetical protein SAMN02745164_01245 [Marinitoga hydrogenitolerans DSM 16785]|uniref:Uncharacterized protein n=1 Tax=Marinitoga hydrogenitolerans (strain DSM 16785 / JCM 12826 / AT1271) TaxID=1122195 RepID=A0A1M4WRJ2_MARH1|nr:hypothetical protein [Marinitoga hydrogenitolerans]SHE83673.1 hypothetical protein SAMN02745164_01245 [Marinitoga hydrogenitolerans DSM 16785]
MYLIDAPYVSNFILIQKDNKFNTLKKIPISTLSNKLIKDISFYTVKTNNNVEVPLPILNGIYYIDLYINGIRYFSKDIEFRNLLYQLK